MIQLSSTQLNWLTSLLRKTSSRMEGNSNDIAVSFVNHKEEKDSDLSSVDET